MIYLKEFETTAEYETAESSLILPNVSLIIGDNSIRYNPFDPYYGHEYVDLGLTSGTLWAKYNIGANSETDYGYYYQYGKGAAQYSATSGETNYNGMENPLAPSADTAIQVWGGSWHTPTKAQCEELTANTTPTWETNFNNTGVAGMKLTSKNNGNYIFLPAGGFYIDGNNTSIGNNGAYATSNNNGDGAGCWELYISYYLEIETASIYPQYRKEGKLVRPVFG